MSPKVLYRRRSYPVVLRHGLRLTDTRSDSEWSLNVPPTPDAESVYVVPAVLSVSAPFTDDMRGVRGGLIIGIAARFEKSHRSGKLLRFYGATDGDVPALQRLGIKLVASKSIWWSCCQQHAPYVFQVDILGRRSC